jgi:hypothetical protein
MPRQTKAEKNEQALKAALKDVATKKKAKSNGGTPRRGPVYPIVKGAKLSEVEARAIAEGRLIAQGWSNIELVAVKYFPENEHHRFVLRADQPGKDGDDDGE